MNKQISIYLKNKYHEYSKQIDLFMNKVARDFNKLLDHVKQTLLDLLAILKLYSDKPVTDMSPEPHSLNEYYNSKTFLNFLAGKYLRIVLCIEIKI